MVVVLLFSLPIECLIEYRIFEDGRCSAGQGADAREHKRMGERVERGGGGELHSPLH